MHLKTITILYTFLILLLLTASCKKETEIEKPIPILNSLIEANKKIRCNIYYSKIIEDSTVFSYYSWLIDTLIEKNAEVKLYIDDIYCCNINLVNNEGYFYYETDSVIAEAGKKYRIEAIVPNYPTIWGETTVPLPVDIINYSCTKIPSQDNFKLKIKITANEQNDYYEFNSWSIVLEKDPIMDPDLPIFSLKASFQNTYTLINIINIFIFPKTIYLSAVTNDYYLYYKSIVKYHEAKESIFSQPVQIYSNVKNGLGCVSAINKDSIIINF